MLFPPTPGTPGCWGLEEEQGVGGGRARKALIVTGLPSWIRATDLVVY